VYWGGQTNPPTPSAFTTTLSERGFRSMSVRSPPLFLSERLRPRQFLYPASTNFAASTMFQFAPVQGPPLCGKRSQMGMAPSTVP
jgi:hypothetical protein